jgi:hypothetical protein
MRLIQHMTPPKDAWTMLPVLRAQTPESVHEMIRWCTDLDGSEGVFTYRMVSYRHVIMWILDPNQAFQFKVRWV